MPAQRFKWKKVEAGKLKRIESVRNTSSLKQSRNLFFGEGLIAGKGTTDKVCIKNGLTINPSCGAGKPSRAMQRGVYHSLEQSNRLCIYYGF